MFLDRVIYHNAVKDWLLAVAITIIVYFLTSLTKHILHKKLNSFASGTASLWDDLIAELAGRFHAVFFFDTFDLRWFSENNTP